MRRAGIASLHRDAPNRKGLDEILLYYALFCVICLKPQIYLGINPKVYADKGVERDENRQKGSLKGEAKHSVAGKNRICRNEA